MSFSDWIGIWSLIVGVVGAVVGIIGCLNLSKANKIAAQCNTNSKITLEETLNSRGAHLYSGQFSCNNVGFEGTPKTS